jgi:hypothetical protein
MSVIYTEMVRRYYTEHRPRAAEALGSPQEMEDYFRSLGAQIEEQVQQDEDKIAGADPVGETYLQKVGRLRMARAQAAEIALADLLYSTPPENDDEEEVSEQGHQLLQIRREMNEASVLLAEQMDRELQMEMAIQHP